MAKTLNYDYHIHANIINGAQNAEKYILRAIELGLDEICITDHAPFRHISNSDRIPFGRLSDYCDEVHRLAEKYSADITVRCGMEIDYHPNLVWEIEDILKNANLDYVLGSSHLHISGMTQKPLCEYTAQEFVEMSFNNYLLAVKTGYFNALAHIDMYRWIIGTPERFKLADQHYDLGVCTPIIREIFSEMEKRGTALEVNTHLMRPGDTEWVYPGKDIMEIAREYRLTYRYGSDAHSPQSVGHGIKEITESPVYMECWRAI